MSTPNYGSARIVDHGPEVTRAPWLRHDDPKQVYTDTGAGISTPQSKYENGYGYGHARQEQLANSNNTGASWGKKILFGLRIAGWSVLLVALTALIVGAAVRGGVGSALASCNSEKSNLNEELASCSVPTGNTAGGSGGAPSVSVALATATVTVSASTASGTTVVAPIDLTNFTVTSPTTVTDAFTGCPGLNTQRYTSVQGDVYTVYCATDSGFGSPTLEDPDLTLQVFAGLLSYTLNDCMEACSAFNAFSARNNVPEMVCRSITFNHKMSQSIVNNDFVTCWFKNGTLAESDLPASGDTVSCMMNG